MTIEKEIFENKNQPTDSKCQFCGEIIYFDKYTNGLFCPKCGDLE